jgi:hypothetical protein
MKAEALRLFVERRVDAATVRNTVGTSDTALPNLQAQYTSTEELTRNLFHEPYREYGHMTKCRALVPSFPGQLS